MHDERYSVKLSFATLGEAEEFFEEVRHDHLDDELGLRLQEVADLPSPAEETQLVVTRQPGNSPWVVPPAPAAAAAEREGR